jgi:hypothetical protein
MFLTLAGVMSVSFFCHDVRCGSPPSIGQLALAGVCASGTPVKAAAALTAITATRKVRLIGAFLRQLTSTPTNSVR